MLVEQFITVKQKVTMASVAFDDQAVADFFEDQVDAGRKPEQFARIWLHTHPGSSPEPSGLDEETFCRVFGGCQWAVLFVLARRGASYARLRFNVGPGGDVLIPVDVDYRRPFGPSAFEAWETEYQANIEREVDLLCDPFGKASEPLADASLNDYFMPEDWLEELETFSADQRQFDRDNPTDWPDSWTDESEVIP